MLRENTRLWRGLLLGGALRQGEIANEPGDEPEADERHVMLQAGLADVGMIPGLTGHCWMGQFQWGQPQAGQLGSARLKPQDAEQDLQAGPSLPLTALQHPRGQCWLPCVQDLLNKPWKLLCAASNHPSPSLTPPWDSPKPKMPRQPRV